MSNKIANEPVITTIIIAIVTQLGGALVLLANDYTVPGILVAAGTLLTGIGGQLARSAVRPVVKLGPEELARIQKVGM